MHLLRLKDYEAARVEFERYRYFAAPKTRGQEALLRIGQCQFFLKDWDKALEVFDDCVSASPEGPWVDDARYWSVRTTFRRTDYEIAIEKAEAFLSEFPESIHMDECQAIIAWSLVGDLKWDDASEAFGVLSGMYPEGSLERQQSLTLSSRALEAKDLPRRSPRLAALFSTLVPGLGQFYARQKGDSLFAAVLNGLSITLAVEAFSKGRVSTGIVATAIASTFYLGNIYGARNAAIRYNEHEVKKWIDQMKRNNPVDVFAEEFSE